MNTETLPEKTLNGITFFPVPEFDAPTVAFGARENAFFPRRNLPKVPRQYEEIAAGLFYNGGRLPELSPLVDAAKARRAVRAWLSSFAPPHESKMATVAYALWVWATLSESNQGLYGS